MGDEMVKILNGNTFVVSDERGDIEASSSDPTGLFSFDTRFLSKWLLTVNGERLTSLSTDDLQYFEARFFLVPGAGSVYVNAKLSVIRQRAVGNGFPEELTILNHDDAPVDLTVRIEADCDFADLFEVKDALQKKGTYAKQVDGRLAPPDLPARHLRTVDGDLVVAALRARRERADVRDHDRAARDLDDRARRRHRDARTGNGRATARSLADQVKRPITNMAQNLARWLDDAPRLECDWETLPQDLPPEPRRSGRAPLLAADRRAPQPPGRRSAVVHDDVRTRQHLHEPAGAALHVGAGGDDAARARAAPGHPRRRLPRRGSRAGSCTRCASAR